MLGVLLFALAAPAFPAGAGTSPPKMIVYYFHATRRCATCMAIENLSKEVLETRYGAQLKAGVIEWQSVDVQQPKNRFYIQRYQLVSSSLVVVRLKDGKQDRWRTLDQTWSLVRKRDDFTRYVQTNIDKLLGD